MKSLATHQRVEQPITAKWRLGFGSFRRIQALIVVAALIAVVAGMSSRNNALPHLPDLELEPLTIQPRYNDPRVVSDDQLFAVLDRLKPSFGMERPKINYVDHALRFWGVRASFSDPNCLSGRQLRDLLIDDQTFVNAWGTETRPLLDDQGDGVSVRVQQGNASSSHVDHTLASLAEAGTPLDQPLITRERKTSVESLLRNALVQFSLNQREYEWTVLTLALYSKGAQPWVTREGQQITFDRLAERLMRERLSQGVCYGNHRLYTLAVLINLDDDHALLSPETRSKVLDHLTDATKRLVQTQSLEGYWDATWARDGRLEEDDSAAGLLRSRILATGHALEWWAIAPEQLLPPRENIVRAGQWLAREIETMREETIVRDYTFLSHAGRALALWRGDLPFDVYQQLQSQRENRE